MLSTGRIGLLIILLAGFAWVKGQNFPVVSNQFTSFQSYNNASQVVDVGAGEFIIAWRSSRNGAGYSNLYLQKVNHLGQFLWEGDGTPICPIPSNQDKFDISPDAFGGIVIVWEDGREGKDKEKLYLQRINARGEMLWDPMGVKLCAGEGSQTNPQIEWDNKNGFYVVWEDSRRGGTELDIYAQHISVSGRTSWMPEGLPIVTSPNIQQHITLGSDGETGVIILWEDFRNGRYWNLYAQKLDRKGDFAWSPNGLDIFAGREENHHNASMVPDGYGGFLFVYQKYSEQTRGYDIFRGRIKVDGTLVYHYSTCFANEDQINPVICKKGRDVIVSWEDHRNGNKDIYAQQIRIMDGIFQWDQNGMPVSNSPQDDRLPSMVASISSNYQMFVWQRWEGRNKTLWIQKLDNFGQPLLEPEGMPVCRIGKEQEQQSVVSDGNGGLMVSWTDYRETGRNYIYLQHFNTNGLPLYKPEGTKLGSEHDGPFPKIEGLEMLATRDGYFYLAWSDFRNGKGNSDIFIQKLDEFGNPKWRTNGIPVCVAAGEQSRPRLIEDGVGGVILAWVDTREARNDNIFAQRISPTGRMLWQIDGVPVCEAERGQSQIQMVSDAKEGVVICWSDARDLLSSGFDLYIQRINHQGDIMWGRDGKAFAKFEGLQTAPSLASDGDGGAFVAWQDNRTGFSNIYMQHINSFGIFEWEYGGRLPHPGDYHQRTPKLVRNFVGDLILVWEDAASGDGNEKIRINSLTVNGFKQWGSRGKMVAPADGKQSQPSLLTDESGNIWVTWLDERAKSEAGVKIYSQQFTSDGKNLWDFDGVSLGSKLKEYNDYAVILNPKSYAYYFWSASLEDGTQKVFFQKLRPDGAKKVGFYGSMVGDRDSEQMSPVMAINRDSRVMVCWVKKDPSNGQFSLLGTFLKEL
ncbi:MAG: hypothetical protein H6581_00770 [Bacteroidia bacterium]|nr:hypothetical protein [Bacteroidia bacterium]